MANTMQLALPPLFINGYIRQQLVDFGLVPDNPDFTPIMPVQPGDISMYYDDLRARSGEGSPVFIQYDRLIRFRPNPFYRNKREQVMYYMYCTSLSKITDANRIITDALDREDSSAQDINAWCAKAETTDLPFNVYFHNTKVFQADETRDLMQLVSARTVYVNKLIIEYDYHTKDNITVNGVAYTNPYT